MTHPVRPDVEEFVRRYERAARDSDVAAVADCFAETFLNLDPTSAGPVPRDAMLAALPMRAQLFGSIGVAGLDLAEVSEQPLDELHTLVATTWQARFTDGAADRTPLVLPSHFLLRRDGTSWRIVAYLNHTDLKATFRERAAAHA